MFGKENLIKFEKKINIRKIKKYLTKQLTKFKIQCT